MSDAVVDVLLLAIVVGFLVTVAVSACREAGSSSSDAERSWRMRLARMRRATHVDERDPH